QRVLVEAHVSAVLAPRVLLDAHDHTLDHGALLDLGAGQRLLHRGDDDVAQAGVTAVRAAQHLDALDALRAGVVGDVQERLHLDHGCDPVVGAVTFGVEPLALVFLVPARATPLAAPASSVSACASAATSTPRSGAVSSTRTRRQ